MTVFAFGNNLSPTNLLTLCKNEVVHTMMSNALLLWLLSKGRGGKTQSNRSMCVRVIRRHVQRYVCVHIAEDAGSSAGKVNWALCWVKAYSAQTKGPIKKKKACYWKLKSPTLSDGAFLAVSDQRHGWSQTLTVTSSEPTTVARE